MAKLKVSAADKVAAHAIVGCATAMISESVRRWLSERGIWVSAWVTSALSLGAMLLHHLLDAPVACWLAA